MIELSTSGNEIKTMYFKVAEQEFCIIQTKNPIKYYKNEKLNFFPKNS